MRLCSRYAGLIASIKTALVSSEHLSSDALTRS
jgi:hypothetical protein